MCYLSATSELGLHMWMGGDANLKVVTMCDADHAGCPTSSRSTTGACSYLVGPSTCALISWKSRRQGCCAVSTAEAETVALSETTRADFLPLVDLASHVLDRDVSGYLGSDSSACVAAVEKGVSAALRFIRKVHRVSLAMLHDVFQNQSVHLKHISGTENVSDIMTKPLTAPRFAELRRAVCVSMPFDPALDTPAILMKLSV